MTSTSHRSRQPELLRAALLVAAADLLASGQAVSIGAVAEKAEVSKGAVQHHFGTREDMFKALFDELLADFETHIASVRGIASSTTEAYVNATLVADAHPASLASWRAMLVAMVVDRSLSERWSAWVDQDRQAAAPETTPQLVARLAADGLWLSDLLSTYRLSDAERQDVATFVQQLAQAR